uniref:RNA-binding protein 33 isoform X4 n=1 Tax=Monopterus albus TaxID=43700 RepID=UPI0009B4CB3B|nr:RNA-binding protein 33 isoform X4 [Monopterus albus]
MSANDEDYDFDEYDKPGAERFRRRRGGQDDLESDLEEDLLEEDWLSTKKNPSEVSDEELNDDLLQSDDEDVNMSGQDVSFNAPYNSATSFDEQEPNYTDDVVNLGAEGCEEGDVEAGYQQDGEERYVEEYSQDDNAGMPEDQMDYTGELAECEDGCQDEVLDIQINETIDGEFQNEDDYNYYDDEPLDEHGVHQEEAEGEEQQQEEEEEEEEQEEEEEETAESAQVFDTKEVENAATPEKETKEESDEEDEEDEESGRIRFKSERKDGVVMRPVDASIKRRNIPETLELSDKAKQDLKEFEEQERQKRQNRFMGQGRGGGGRGNRGRGGFPGFGMADFRGGHRGRMNEQRLPLMGNMGMQSSRMPPPHQHQLQSQQHHSSHARGPLSFQEHGRPLPQQPLQPLIPPHMSHRSLPLRPQMDSPARMMGSPPPNFPQHHQEQPPQPRHIYINPHFRGPMSSSVQVPLMPPVQSQPRPAVGPQRFPGPGDFQQHLPGNFGQPHRPPHHMEPYRNQPPQGPPNREPLFMGDRTESARFPGQHMFDPHSNNLHQQQQLPGQGHMGFSPSGPTFNQPGQSPVGLFSREPPRPNIPPHQGHEGLVGLNQQGGSSNHPRPFMSPRQQFGQQGNLFPPPQVPFGMQVRIRGLMHSSPVSQLPHHNPLPSHQTMQQQHHRQELPHHQQLSLNEPRPMMHHSQTPFHQQHARGTPRLMTLRPQNSLQRNMSNRQRLNTPVSKQLQQRNSNLRELPVAPSNTDMNSARPATTPSSLANNIRPVAKATQGVRPGQNTEPECDGGKGGGQSVAKNQSLGGAGRAVVHKEIPSTPTSTAPEDPDEDEETQQYRMKIEEQKRLREMILKRKEMRRQMQAGVRKKELLERLNSQTNTQSQGLAPAQIQPEQKNQQMPHPAEEQQPEQKQQQQQQQLQPLQQKPFPQRTQQSLNQLLKNPNQGTHIPPSGTTQTPTPRTSVKTRLQMVKGSPQQQQTGPGPDQQWKQPQQNQQQFQQRRSSSLQNINRPGTQILGSQIQSTQKNIPLTASASPGPAQNQGLKPGAKRTVMHRSKSVEGHQVPQKVRVVKLSGASGKGPETTCTPVQQQGTWLASLLNQGIQRKVTMPGQQQQGLGAAPQASQGGMVNPQQNRVVMSGRGRGSGQMGRGRSMSARPSQRSGEKERCTVSIEGLSSSTTNMQLQNLLRSIGPIEMFTMMPQQRKAIAKFTCPQHAASFQMSFHRHMIDLSHIDVSLIDG